MWICLSHMTLIHKKGQQIIIFNTKIHCIPFICSTVSCLIICTAVFLSYHIEIDDGLRSLMNNTANYWQTESWLLTYIGGSRSRYNGVFAGVADIQGMDMYVCV